MEDYETFLTHSEYFIKYIANTHINSEIGTAKIIDIGRCESNMENILVSMGFKEDYMIIKNFLIFHYKNKPIWIYLYRISKTEAFEYINIPSYREDIVAK